MHSTLLVLGSVFLGWANANRYQGRLGDDKIVGGNPLYNIQEQPYMIAILRKSVYLNYVCAGSLLSPFWVSTACHCVAATDEGTGRIYSLVRDYPLPAWEFSAGTVHLVHYNESHQFRRAGSLQHHPKCDLELVRYDVGLAKMVMPFITNQYVWPVKMISLRKRVFEPRLEQIIEQSSPLNRRPHCVAAGWGSVWFESLAEFLWSTPSPVTSDPVSYEDPDQLKTTTRYLMNDAECFKAMVEAVRTVAPGYLDDPNRAIPFQTKTRKKIANQICNMSRFKNESLCRGDSGGGLVCDGFLIGVTSWGYGCGDKDPDVAQNLAPVLDWLGTMICNITCAELDHRQPNCPVTRQFVDDCRKRPASTSRPFSDARRYHICPTWLMIALLMSAIKN